MAARRPLVNAGGIQQELGSADYLFISGNATIGGAFGAESVRVLNVASAVNRLEMSGGVTGFSPTLASNGTDTNRGIAVALAGTGALTVFSGTSSALPIFAANVGATTDTGYPSARSGAAQAIFEALGSVTDVSFVMVPKGIGNFIINTGGSSAGYSSQLIVNHTANATAAMTITGSASGNPVLSTSANNIAFGKKVYPATDAGATQAVAGITGGSGVPSNANGANGDYHFRGDTPATPGQRQYIKSAGAWVPADQYAPSGTSAVATTIDECLRRTVSIFDFLSAAQKSDVSARTFTLDCTAAIDASITANPNSIVYFPPGIYNYNGAKDCGNTILQGAGRLLSQLRITSTTQQSFYFSGTRSGIRGMGIIAGATQTAGSFLRLGGIETFIEDFYINGDFNGVLMNGVGCRIRHGKFQDAATGAIRVRCEGGDTSQMIEDVIMGAQSPPNIAAAGIRIRNNSSLMIKNTQVITMTNGLLIDPTSSAENVLSLFVDTCFFDNCTNGIVITPSSTAKVARLYFTNVWTSSGATGTQLSGPAASINGVTFTNLQCNLNSSGGVTTGTGITNLKFIGGNVSQTTGYGMLFNAIISRLEVKNMVIGPGDNFTGNTQYGIGFGVTGNTNINITGNYVAGNTVGGILNASFCGAGSIIRDNTGYNPVGVVTPTVGASPYTYTNGPEPATAYITGGTLSVIATGGQTVFTATEKTLDLGPNESVTITYTAAPTLKVYKH